MPLRIKLSNDIEMTDAEHLAISAKAPIEVWEGTYQATQFTKGPSPEMTEEELKELDTLKEEITNATR